MKEINLSGVDLQNIKVFLSAAEHLSFTAAGNEHFLTQSTVSKTISSLEKSLGLDLFDREKGKISLTAAGQILNSRLQGLIREFETAVELADQAQNGSQHQLRIGIPNFIEFSQIVSFADHFKQRHPDIAVQIQTQDLEVLRHKVIRGDLDIIFTVLFESDSMPAANVGWILLEPMPAKLFVSTQHQLANRRKITVADLQLEKFISFSPSMVPGYIRMLTDLCAASGFSPVFGRYVENQQSLMLALMLNEGVLVADDLLCPSNPKSIIGFELENTLSGKIMAWNRNPNHRHIRAFIDLVMHPLST